MTDVAYYQGILQGTIYESMVFRINLHMKCPIITDDIKLINTMAKNKQIKKFMNMSGSLPQEVNFEEVEKSLAHYVSTGTINEIQLDNYIIF